jgi:hypothetical protein
MATLGQITDKAFRELGVTAVGDVPETAEHNEAFIVLQDILNTIIGYEMGEALTDVNIGSSSNLNSSAKALDAQSEITSLYIPNNVRINCNLTAPVTLYLHPKPREGDRVTLIDQSNNFATNNLTLKGNGRGLGGPSNFTITISASGSTPTYFYRADLGYWTTYDVSVDSLPSPFAGSFDDMLVLWLAKRIAPRYGAQWQPQQEESLQRLVKQFRARYRQETQADSEFALIRLPSTWDNKGYSFGSQPSFFDKGLP